MAPQLYRASPSVLHKLDDGFDHKGNLAGFNIIECHIEYIRKNFNNMTFPETYRYIETKLTKFGYKLMATYSTRKSDGKIVSHIRNVNFVNI